MTTAARTRRKREWWETHAPAAWQDSFPHAIAYTRQSFFAAARQKDLERFVRNPELIQTVEALNQEALTRFADALDRLEQLYHARDVRRGYPLGDLPALPTVRMDDGSGYNAYMLRCYVRRVRASFGRVVWSQSPEIPPEGTFGLSVWHRWFDTLIENLRQPTSFPTEHPLNYFQALGLKNPYEPLHSIQEQGVRVWTTLAPGLLTRKGTLARQALVIYDLDFDG